MSDSHTWNINIEEQIEPVGSIHSNTIYTSGDFPPNTNIEVCDLWIQNTGDGAGLIKWGLYEFYPGGGWIELDGGTHSISAGGITHAGSLTGQTPSILGPWNLCIAVWADGYETQPSCGTLNLEIEQGKY